MSVDVWEISGGLIAEAGSGGIDLASVVGRHVDLVYSAALRRVGDRHLAEDVTQAVFVILARKIKSVRDEAALGPWLLQTTRYAAANALRMEARRRRREQAVALTNGSIHRQAGACSSNPTDVLLWQEIAQQLDDAVLKLPALDRQAVVLRFFEDKPVGDVALALNVTRGAAQRRLTRAIDTLRRKLSRAGLMMSGIDASSFAILLSSYAVRSAPPGLWHAALKSATAGAGATGTSLSIAKGALKMMAWTKAKIAAAVVVASVICGAGGVVSVQHAMAQNGGGNASAKPQALAAPVPKAVDKNAPSLESAPPVVIETVPRAGADDVDASTTEIKVTYSKEMQDGSWSWSSWGSENSPKMTDKPHYLDDKKTCVATVKLVPGKFYAIWLNSDKFGNFRDANGQKAVPYLLVFETKK